MTIHGKVILLIASLIPLKICDNVIFPRQKLTFCKAFLEGDTLLWNFFLPLATTEKKLEMWKCTLLMSFLNFWSEIKWLHVVVVI